jgi:hypothetical protein
MKPRAKKPYKDDYSLLNRCNTSPKKKLNNNDSDCDLSEDESSSDCDTYRNYNDDSHEEEDDDEGEEAKQKQKHEAYEKNSMFHKYTTDGIAAIDYNKKRPDYRNFIQAECCGRYYKDNAYFHQTKFKLGIKDIKTCIHCFIGFDVNRYGESKNLTVSEKECLKYYIDSFTNEHDLLNCEKKQQYGICLLCESITNKKMNPLENMETQNNQKVVETIIEATTTNEPYNIIMTDIVLIDDPVETNENINVNIHDFVLIL